jgi:hypothetical protein
LDGSASGKAILKQFCIDWLGGQDVYDALRLEGNTGTSEQPEDAIRRLRERT